MVPQFSVPRSAIAMKFSRNDRYQTSGDFRQERTVMLLLCDLSLETGRLMAKGIQRMNSPINSSGRQMAKLMPR